MFDLVRRGQIYWKRLRLPIGRNDLVLDVGSGDDPHPRANVLMDLYVEQDLGRVYSLVQDDRPLIIGDAHRMPFKDRAFDYVICSHLLEHVRDPAQVIQELTRIAPRGYVETPSEFQEKIGSNPYHRWYVRKREDTLVFTLKQTPHFDEDVRETFGRLWRDPRSGWRAVSYRNPQLFVTAFPWETHIRFEVRGNAEGELPPWLPPEASSRESPPRRQARLKRLIKRAVRGLLGSRRRVNLLEILACPVCHQHPLIVQGNSEFLCRACNRHFPIRRGVPSFVENRSDFIKG